MRAVSLPRFLPAQLLGAQYVSWYALLIALALLASAVLVAIVVLQSPPAEPELLGPFRWFSARSMA